MNHSLLSTAKVDFRILGVEVNAHSRALLVKLKHRRANELVFDLENVFQFENLQTKLTWVQQRSLPSVEMEQNRPLPLSSGVIPDRFSVSFERNSLDQRVGVLFFVVE